MGGFLKPKLILLLLGAFSLEAGSAVKVHLSQASVISGAGREPRGAVPPPRLSARLEITGLSPKAKPRFKVWSLNTRALQALKVGGSPVTPKLGATALDCTFARMEGAYQLQGTWIGPVDPDISLVVEVFLGRRRVALAASPVEEHLLPSAKPSGGKAEN